MAAIQQIWQSFMDGDDQALGRLYNYYQPTIYKYALYVLKDKESAKTAVQDCFLKLWSHRDQMQEVNNPAAYLLTIGRNICFDMLRKKAVQFVEWHQSDDCPSHLNADNHIQYQETEKLLQNSLAQLTGRQKQIYKLSRDEGFSYHDIGHQLNLSPATVKKHMSIILQKLKRHMHHRVTVGLLAVLFSLN